jgi:hypothetical protein
MYVHCTVCWNSLYVYDEVQRNTYGAVMFPLFFFVTQSSSYIKMMQDSAAKSTQ